MPDFLIIAHRGDSDNAPENTLPAFDLALQQGFAHFETDCQLSADGQAIILHDEKLGRTNNGTPGSLAWELSCHQLQQLDAGAWFDARFAGIHIPTLQQLLDAYKDKAHIHLVSGWYRLGVHWSSRIFPTMAPCTT
jgi:glycerophosphoryl diester phosphodiesterase